jgi:chromosome segregation ATPase
MRLEIDISPRLAEALSRPLRLEIIHRDARVEEKLDRALELLTALKTQGDAMALDLATLETELTETKDAVSAIITYTQTIITELQALAAELAGQPAIQARLNAMADELNAEQTRIAEAIVAGTGAEEPGGEEPTEPEPVV